MHLSRVVFPHPEGPIKAVTQFCLNSISTFFNACLAPNQAFKDVTASFGLESLSGKIEDLFLEGKVIEDSASCLLLIDDFKILNKQNHL